MPKWIEGTVVNQKRWTQNLFTLQVEADVAAFEAGQFAKLALAAEGEMGARPDSFVNAPKEPPPQLYYVTLPDRPLPQPPPKKAGRGPGGRPRPGGSPPRFCLGATGKWGRPPTRRRRGAE